jgi:hypothetical protein
MLAREKFAPHGPHLASCADILSYLSDSRAMSIEPVIADRLRQRARPGLQTRGQARICTPPSRPSSPAIMRLCADAARVFMPR